MTQETVNAPAMPNADAKAEATQLTLIKSVPLGKDSGKRFDVPLHELLPPEVIELAVKGATPKARLLRDVLLTGTGRIFVDVQASCKTDAERQGQCDKKLDAWREGEMHVKGGGGGGETVEGEVKRLIVAAYVAATGETEGRALLKFKGRGYDVLSAIARQKAEATIAVLADDATDEQKAARGAAVEAAFAEAFEAAKTAWNAKAEESLKAKEAARTKAATFAVTDLI